MVEIDRAFGAVPSKMYALRRPTVGRISLLVSSAYHVLPEGLSLENPPADAAFKPEPRDMNKQFALRPCDTKLAVAFRIRQL